MSHTKRIATLLLITAILGLVLGAAANMDRQGKPTAMAVVDIQDVFNGCKEKTTIDADVTQAIEKLNQEIEDGKLQIRQLQADLELLRAGEPAYEQKRQQIGKRLVELKVAEEFGKQRIGREQMIRYESLYRTMRSTCAEVAKAGGYDLVLYRESKKLQYQNFAQLVNQIAGRKVLYASEQLDITDPVLLKMNTQWQSRDR